MNRRAGTIAGLALAALMVVTAPCGHIAALASGAGAVQGVDSAAEPRILLHASRQLDSDLEITGMVDGLSPHTTGYVRFSELMALPQVTIVVQDDENLPSGTHVTGVPLAELARALRAEPASDLLDAWCVDQYRTHYSAGYMRAHHPVLGLKVEGHDPDQWAEQRHQRSTGRYFITHEDFRPSFNILKHADEPQVPTGVMRLDFSTEAALSAAIAPRAGSTGRQVEDGFVIARQNCLRCHNAGAYGGRKAGVEWPVLSMLAGQQSSFFEKYVRDPKSVAPGARMPGNPEYDDATLHALTEYFRSVGDDTPGKESGAAHE